MKQITTLVSDIYKLLENKNKVAPEIIDEFTNKLNTLLKIRFNEDRGEFTLSMSSLGQPDRKLWYKKHKPDSGEQLRGETLLKFIYGDIIELLVLMLAKASGHTVKGMQDEISYEGLLGHRDAIIDGVLVDVKSASSYAFDKFKYHKLMDDDPFGYIDQLSLYVTASQDDIDIKRAGSFIAVNKENGQLALDTYKVGTDKDYRKIISNKKAMLDKDKPPQRCYPDEPDGASGNRKLGVNCSYCEFKKECWPGLRTFLYSGKPRYLTTVVKEPNVLEFKDRKENNNGEETPKAKQETKYDF